MVVIFVALILSTLYLFLASVSTAVAMIAAWSGAYFYTILLYYLPEVLHVLIVPWVGEFRRRAGDESSRVFLIHASSDVASKFGVALFHLKRRCNIWKLISGHLGTVVAVPKVFLRMAASNHTPKVSRCNF